MASQEDSLEQDWKGLLTALWSGRAPWTDAAAIRRLAADFAVDDHPALATKIPGTTGTDKQLSTALQQVIDDVLTGWRDDGEPDEHGTHSYRQAVAVMLRRLDSLTQAERDTLKRAKHDLEALAGDSRVVLRQSAVGTLWNVKSFRNQQGAVQDALAAALATADRALPATEKTRSAPSYYHPVQRDEVDDGFWWRASTKAYVEDLARGDGLTLFAGADGNSDVGDPIHERIARLALIQWLTLDPELRGLGREDAKTIAAAIADDLASESPSFIGGVLRGMAMDHENTQATVEQIVSDVTGNASKPESEIGNRSRGPFVDKALVELAVAIARCFGAAKIVNAHNDADIEEALEGSPLSSRIDLYELHPSDGSSLRRQTVLSESDLFSERVPGSTKRWIDLLADLVSTDRTLIVGSDIRAPGLVAALARSRDRSERYALIVAHKQGRDAVPPTPEPDERWKRMRTLFYRTLAGRYLDLGVAPIFVDFPAQVPQFLREVKLLVEANAAGKPYDHYADRYDELWDTLAPLFGFGEHGSLDERRFRFQWEWYRWLARLRMDTEEQYQKESHTAEDEKLLYEVWIRSPRRERELFLWATSDHFVTRTSTARRTSLRIDGGVLQTAFREGVMRPQNVTGRKPWRRSVAFPLTLEQPPYHGLTIGMLRIYSTAENGRVDAMPSESATLSEERTIRAAAEVLVELGVHLAKEPGGKVDLKLLDGHARFELGDDRVDPVE